MDTNPNPLLNGILWVIQALTAGVLLFHVYFDTLVDVRQKRSAPPASPHEEEVKSAHEAEPVEPHQPANAPVSGPLEHGTTPELPKIE